VKIGGEELLVMREADAMAVLQIQANPRSIYFGEPCVGQTDFVS